MIGVHQNPWEHYYQHPDSYTEEECIEHWLYANGGRLEGDLLDDEEGKYVLMGNGRGGEMKVYLPIYKLSTVSLAK